MGPAAVLQILSTTNASNAQAQRSKLPTQMKATGATAEASAAATAASWNKTGQRMSSIGKTMTTRVSLPVAAVGAVSVKMARDFDESMLRVQNLAGASQQQMESWSKS